MQLLLIATGRAWPWDHFGAIAVSCASASAIITSLVARRGLVRRVERLRAFLEEQVGQGHFLQRLPDLGPDELGRAADALNRLLASITTLRVSLIDQGRELAATQEELRLKAALAAKTQEVETRLAERRLLFEILRVGASSTDLEETIRTIGERLAPVLRLREFALLLRTPDGKFVVRAAQGFADPSQVLGRTITPGEGVAGEVARARRTLVISDVTHEPEYLAFWNQAAREGSFAAVPIHGPKELLGMLALTRPPGDPLSEAEIRLLDAIADQAALAIRHAQLFEELRELSTHDELTGLANRRLLTSQVEREVDRARRFNQPFSVLAIDIDHFKLLNDRCGHPVGDQALRAVAEVLRTQVRKVDTVARSGGEEFVIVLPKTDVSEAGQAAEKLRQAIARTPMPGGAGQPEGRLTISVGVAELAGADDGSTLLARADEALYQAKQAGRNRVALHPGPAQMSLLDKPTDTLRP